MLHVREDWPFEEGLPDEKAGLKCVKKRMKPAPRSRRMKCNLVGTGRAHE